MKETPLKTYIDCEIYNGTVKTYFRNSMGYSLEGCPFRGTSTCTRCPLSPPVECGYNCRSWNGKKDCGHRSYCKCGHDQTVRLQMWGLVE